MRNRYESNPNRRRYESMENEDDRARFSGRDEWYGGLTGSDDPGFQDREDRLEQQQRNRWQNPGYGAEANREYRRGFDPYRQSFERGTYGGNYGGNYGERINLGYGDRSFGSSYGQQNFGPAYRNEYGGYGSGGSGYGNREQFGGSPYTGQGSSPWNQRMNERMNENFEGRDFGYQGQGQNYQGQQGQSSSSGNYGQQGMYGRSALRRGQNFGKGPKGYKRSDERIKEEVCDILAESDIDAREIEVSVKDGEVTLTGMVMDRQLKHLAERLADEVTGVQEIHNQIRVKRSEETPSQTSTQGTQSGQRLNDAQSRNRTTS
jgi:osmotically-inducible protein OsmY